MSEEDTHKKTQIVQDDISKQREDYLYKLCFKSTIKGNPNKLDDTQLNQILNCKDKLSTVLEMIGPNILGGDEDQ